MISPQRREEVIDALRRGTVPRNSLDAFAVGLGGFESAIEEELRKVASGGSVFKAVCGEYGCGKTFFARWLADRHDTPSIRLVAHGEMGPAALHVAALEPACIASLRLEDSLPTWRQLMTADDGHSHLHNAVHGALRYYDLPDLKKLVSSVE